MTRIPAKSLTIGYVSRMTGIASSTLRSWEGHGLITPHKQRSGHRLYSTDDVERVRRIDMMRRIGGHSLAQVQTLLDQTDGPTPTADSDAGNPTQCADEERIGTRARRMRKEAQLTLQAVSDRTGIATSHLSMFERGKAVLSPARLGTLAAVFGRSLGDFLGATTNRATPVIRRGQGRMVDGFGPGVGVEQITVSENLLDAEVWTIEPGRESEGFYAHDGEELIHVLSGAFELTLLGEEPQVLRAGDSAYFSSRMEHRWRNPGEDPAVLLWVNTDVERLRSMAFERSRPRAGGAGEPTTAEPTTMNPTGEER